MDFQALFQKITLLLEIRYVHIDIVKVHVFYKHEKRLILLKLLCVVPNPARLPPMKALWKWNLTYSTFFEPWKLGRLEILMNLRHIDTRLYLVFCWLLSVNMRLRGSRLRILSKFTWNKVWMSLWPSIQQLAAVLHAWASKSFRKQHWCLTMIPRLYVNLLLYFLLLPCDVELVILKHISRRVIVSLRILKTVSIHSTCVNGNNFEPISPFKFIVSIRYLTLTFLIY